MHLQYLRKRYPKFIYKKYSYKISGRNLEIFFDFTILPDKRFHPKVVIKNIPSNLSMIAETSSHLSPRPTSWGSASEVNKFDNLIFQLGLIEMVSYWKATCSPIIEIRAGFLNSEQIRWWKDLIVKGMGQFFYENKINFRKSNFLKIISSEQENVQSKEKVFKGKLKNRYLVPFASGRDSIVTLESLKSLKKKKEIALFSVNPNRQMKKAIKATGIEKQIIINRTIDKKLLELNKRGFLNGHTPFTALLSFLSVLAAVLFNYKNIVFSNEKSANEGNLKYLGKMINHQWAKSSEFEKMFKKYCKKYLSKDINYFSYLRKYGDLEISKKFTKYPKYFPVFSSCNASMKIGAKQIRWCGNCPKCLFVYATLYPFLNKKDLLKVFGKDIFQNKKLLPVMKNLIGKGRPKPFECVGTKKENRIAFKLSLKKATKEGKIPYLLKKAIVLLAK